MWRYNNKTDFEIPTGAVGFVYEIRRTNLLDDIFSPYLYIGKKQLFGKGKFNKGVESNWRDYWGSSNYLEDDIIKYGKQNFERHILMFCYSYSELNWEELRLQIELGTLTQNEFSPMPKKYYNFNVINKLYTDRYFDDEDTDRLQSYLLLDNMRDYPLYLTNEEVSLRIRNGLYDIPKCMKQYPKYRIGSSPDSCLLDIDLDIPGGYTYESDYIAKGTHTLNEAFRGYKFINNGISQDLVNEDIPVEGFENGHLVLQEEVYENIILAINTKTFEVENVPESKFIDGPYVKAGTKPIEVKVGKKVIFKGFAKEFVKETEYEIKETWINRVLKKARTNTWQKLSPTFTKKAKSINPEEILVKKVTKIK